MTAMDRAAQDDAVAAMAENDAGMTTTPVKKPIRKSRSSQLTRGTSEGKTA